MNYNRFIYCEKEAGGTKAFYSYNLIFSRKFCDYFCENFTAVFAKETGLTPSSKVTLSGSPQPTGAPLYEKGEISKLNIVLWIMPDYRDNLSFCWKSKTGMVVLPTDEAFVESDLECWVEGLKPNEYWAAARTEKKQHPFQIANLPFELIVLAIGMEMNLRIFTAAELFPKIIDVVNSGFAAYNVKSEEKGRSGGVVHNWKWENEKDYLNLRVDTGSAGVPAIKKILSVLKKVPRISRVEVDL